jgi:hypothetical protein
LFPLSEIIMLIQFASSERQGLGHNEFKKIKKES